MEKSKPRLTEAQQALVLEHRKLVYYLANRMIGDRYDWMAGDNRQYKAQAILDLRAWGMLALSRAAYYFEEGRNCKFSTYAYRVVRRAMIQFGLRDIDFRVGLGPDRIKGLAGLVASARFYEPGENPSNSDDCPDRSLGPLDELIAREEPDREFIRPELMTLLNLVLIPRHVDILVKYCIEGRSGTDIANEMGISKQRVFQMLDGAFAKLRKCQAFEDALWKQAERAKELSRDDFPNLSWKVA